MYFNKVEFFRISHCAEIHIFLKPKNQIILCRNIGLPTTLKLFLGNRLIRIPMLIFKHENTIIVCYAIQ